MRPSRHILLSLMISFVTLVVTDSVSMAQAPLSDAATSNAQYLRTVVATGDTIRPSYPIVAARSNLLVLFLNVGAEVPVAKHWSVGVDYYYPWIWASQGNKRAFELIFLSAEARYWFGSSRENPCPDRNYLLGHSVGLYGAWGYYDVEKNYHGHQGHAWSVGLDYMYAIPILKGLFHLEFELALGAIWSPNAQPYNVYNYGGLLIKEKGHRKNFSYFGPTKAAVSIVFPINLKMK